MTFQAYLDTIKTKTGLGPDDFRRLAAEKGLLEPGTKPGAILAWVASDYGLGPGHGMAIVSVLGLAASSGLSDEDKFLAQFAGRKSVWRPTFDRLLVDLGRPAELASTATYVSLLKGKAKFGIVALTADRMDVGIKLVGEPPTGRFETAGTWNAMVTHRVRVTDPSQVDDELVGWLQRAYDAAR
jgi:hypothetical protein